MAMTIELVPRATPLTIGDDYAKTNTIEFTIKLTGNDAVWLRLQIPVGKNGVLRELADANDLVVKTLAISDPQPTLKTPAKPPEGVNSSNTNEWSLGDYTNGVKVDGKMELTVAISKVLCRADPGDTAINIIWDTGSSTDNIVPLTITKAKPTSAENPILYFIAEPTFVIGSGVVTLTWDVVGDQNATLDTQQQTGKKVTSPTTDRLTDKWTYTLKVGNKQRQVTVNVLTKDWHELYPLGENAFPSVIFDPGGRIVDALYAIFVRGTERKAVLCKSTDGITGWQIVNKAVPDGMESSPGVRLGNRLWLIGGSTVDWDQKSRRICYYDLDHADQGWQDATVTGADGFEERMGHACVIVGDSIIWAMGGSGRYKTLNDVWRLSINDKTKPITIDACQVRDSDSGKWAPRCMFSAVKYGDEIWVCGGVKSPQGIPLSDIYYYGQLQGAKGATWQPRPGIKDSDVVKNAIGTGVACCGNGQDEKLFIVITATTAGQSAEHDTVMRQLTRSTPTEDIWDKIEKVRSKPTELTYSNHSITTVGFQNRLYVRYLHRNALLGNTVKSVPLYVYVKG